jgi:hypothetical protein
MATLAFILNAPMPANMGTLYTATSSVELASSISLCNTYGIDIDVYLLFQPSGGVGRMGAVIYGKTLAGHSQLTLDERYMRSGYTIRGLANVGNAVQLVSNITK